MTTTSTQPDGDEFNSETSNDNNENNGTYELLPSTEGLDFKLASNGKSYELIGIGTCTATDIFVDSYNGLPVALIGYESFYENSTIKSVVFGDNVKTISGSAFEEASALTSVKIERELSWSGCVFRLRCFDRRCH